jgi:class 3 adenylate cyclase/S1-C subfamily serine protease
MEALYRRYGRYLSQSRSWSTSAAASLLFSRFVASSAPSSHANGDQVVIDSALACTYNPFAMATPAGRSATVTVLFTDLVNSTPITESLGEERAHPIFEAHHHALRNIVHRYGGQELEWLGDGILAEFSSIADGVSAAREMQQDSEAPIEGQELRIRVGVNSGEVMRTESGYFGQTIVIARRLCDSAEAGQILCSRLVPDMLAGREGFVFEEVGEKQLKGISRPVTVFEVVSAPERAVEESERALVTLALGRARRLLGGRVGWTTFPLTIENSGGKTLGVDLHADDPSGRCRILFPGRVTVRGGDSTTVDVQVRPAPRRWGGRPERRPFAIAAQFSDGRPAATVAGEFDDRPYGPVLYGGVLGLGAASVLAALALFQSGGGSDAADAAEPVETVVQVYALAEAEGGYQAVGWGSGTLIDSSGLILTSDDLVDPEFYDQPFDTIGVGLSQGADQPTVPAYIAEVVATNALTGFAVLQITSDELGQPVDPRDLDLPSAGLGDSAEIESGDHLEAIGYSGSGKGAPGQDTETLGERSGNPFAVEIEARPTTVTDLIETFVSGRGSFFQIAIDTDVSPGDLGGGAFNDDGEFVGILIPSDSDGATGSGLVNPVAAAADAIAEGRERAAGGGFVCAGCASDENADDAGESTLSDEELQSLRPMFTDFALVNLDDELIEAVPAGAEEFLVSFSFSGMLDGARFRHRCYHDPQLPVGSFAENLERDYGSGRVEAWTLGEEGTARVGCSTVGTEQDGEPLPEGTYVVTFEVENLVQNPFGSPTITFTIYAQTEVVVS